MKKIDWAKTIKTIGIILVVVLVFLYFDNRSSQRANKIDDNVSNLAYVSEELRSIKYLCEDAMNSGDYEDMYSALDDVESKCEELQKLVDEAHDFFRPRESDDDNSRSWFY